MNTNEFQADISILFKDDRILKEALNEVMNSISFIYTISTKQV